MDTNCRTCSRHDEFQGISVNSISESHQEPIYLMLIYCTQLQFSANDSLPQQICPDCLILLDGAFTFWKQCRQTDDNFRLGLTGKVVIPGIEPVRLESEGIEPVGAVSFHCCLPKCSKVASSLVELEEHAKQDHWLKRRGFELRRKRNHVHVCSVCLDGFGSLGRWEAHQLVLQGLGEKDCMEDPGEQGESSDSDEWPEQEVAGDSFDQDGMELDSEEAPFGKGKRKSNASARGAGAGGLLLFCNGCGYQSNKKFNMSRHQHIWKHEGVTSTASDILSEDPPAEQPAATVSDNLIQFVEVPVKLEPPSIDPDGMVTEESYDDNSSQQQCAYCGMVFYTKAQKVRHLQFNCTALYKPKKSKPTQCPDCNKKFNTKHGLVRHQVFCSMGNEKATSCPTCERVFNKTSNLKRHMALKNCSKKKFQCEYCRASYSKMSALTRHLNNGCMEAPEDLTDERPPPPRQRESPGSGNVECPHCFSRFSRTGNLKRHINESCHVMLKRKAAETTEEQQQEEEEQQQQQQGEDENKKEEVASEQEMMGEESAEPSGEIFTET